MSSKKWKTVTKPKKTKSKKVVEIQLSDPTEDVPKYVADESCVVFLDEVTETEEIDFAHHNNLDD